MPTYVYKFVETGETIEVQQAFTEDALTEATHPESGRLMQVKKVFQPVGVTFRGGGFYKNDNRGSSAPATSGTAPSGDSSSSSPAAPSPASTPTATPSSGASTSTSSAKTNA